MLFGNKKCSNCESNHDIALLTCPVCGAPNEEPEAQKVSKATPMLLWNKQLIIGAIGMFGISVLSAIAMFAAAMITSSDPNNLEPKVLLICNTIAYLVIFAALIFVLLKDWKTILQSGKKWQTYVWAAAGIVVIFGLGFGLTQLRNYLVPSTNENQGKVNEMLTAIPPLAFLVMGIVGPICEEITYRLGFFNFFRRINLPCAYIFSTILFALCHMSLEPFMALDVNGIVSELASLPIYLILGGVLAFIYDRKGLTASCIVHIVYNTINIIIGLATIK